MRKVIFLIILDVILNVDKGWLNMETPKLKVGPGTSIKIKLLSHSGENEEIALHIVPDASADYERGYLGESTPLAKAIKGHTAGETVAYKMEELYAVKIISVSRSSDTQVEELAEERQARYEKVIRQAERLNAINFASSYSGKWGDYDPGSLPEDEKSS